VTVQAALERLEREGWEQYKRELRRAASGPPLAPRDAFAEDHPGHPLGPGYPTGRPLRDEGQSHRQAWAAIVRRDPCAYCGEEAGTVDHIEPQAHAARGLGGVHSWVNFTGACESCNTGKSDMPLLEWLYRRRWSAPVTRRTQRDYLLDPWSGPRPRWVGRAA
jgi:hypothetical protein